MKEPYYGYWLGHPDLSGFFPSMDAMFPGYDPVEEFIFFLTKEARDQLGMDLIGLVEPED